MSDLDFGIEFDNFGDGFSPLAHIDTKTFVGAKGQASEMVADIISNPGYLQQSPGLADLTNGTQAGAVTELIRHILDTPVSTTTTYAVGTTKLFKLSSTAVVDDETWPQVITDMTEGECVIRMKENLFVFYNKASGGDIAAMPLATEVIDPDWGSATDAALEDALHPAATKEDILVFGNGRYLGVYIQGSAVLDVKKLDFGEGAEVADVVFHSNVWWIAVNYGNGRRGQIFLYDGSAMSNILSDEAGIGLQKIGFLFVHNGIVFLAYQDNTSGAYSIGWLSGRQIKPLRYFTGTLPDHRQKTLYKNCLLFCSGGDIWAAGATVEQMAYQISKHAGGGYATLGAIAAPFGTPLIASTDGATNFRLAKFSGLSVASSWKSIFIDTTDKSKLGRIAKIIVATKQLEEGARADITIEGNQGKVSSAVVLSVTGTDVTRHIFRTVDLPPVEDIRVIVNYTNGSTSKNCPIRKITVLGNFVEQ